MNTIELTYLLRLDDMVVIANANKMLRESIREPTPQNKLEFRGGATTRHLAVLSRVSLQLVKCNLSEVYPVLAPKCRVEHEKECMNRVRISY